MTTVLIHGANASSQSWNYIKTFIKSNVVTIDYTSSAGFHNNLADMKAIVDCIKEPVVLIGHSLGGIYAMHLAEHLGVKCRAAASISTPFGGSGLADWAKLMYPWYSLFKDVGYRSKPIVESKRIAAGVTVPWLQIVTTKGNVPWIPANNDGVVTIKSQECIDTMQKVTLYSNHYEVLIHPDTIVILTEYFSALGLQVF
jgi:pimeloyl-ACP methyl ester carboxylesterase